MNPTCKEREIQSKQCKRQTKDRELDSLCDADKLTGRVTNVYKEAEVGKSNRSVSFVERRALRRGDCCWFALLGAGVRSLFGMLGSTLPRPAK